MVSNDKIAFLPAMILVVCANRVQDFPWPRRGLQAQPLVAELPPVCKARFYSLHKASATESSHCSTVRTSGNFRHILKIRKTYYFRERSMARAGK